MLCWPARHVRALLWRLFAWSAWAQPAAVLASTTGEGVGMPSVRLFGLASAIHDGGGTTDDSAALASYRFVGVGSESHCGSGNDR